ncbi:MAG TPA: MerR family transcriptional regulator [Phycicoccus sp.]|mgnify:FL=1|nr:MerR family transcriptional regulator [Phycicoccus sp.]HRA45986.1 MerR family transcriptional regulator [Phycicoccus sp.]
MLTIGEFALHGGVSVRMLRHYDALDLLVPAAVDPHSGYRHYEPAQLARLNRLVTLKELGFTLEQIGPVLDADVSAPDLRAMLLMRRAQIEQQMAQDRGKLSDIERRLRMIEEENLMSELQFIEKALPATTLAQLTAVVDDVTQIGPTIGPMFERLVGDMIAVGIDPASPTIAWYDAATEGDGMRIAAGVPVTDASPTIPDTEEETLPAVDRAVTVVHHGDMASIQNTWQQLMRYCAAAGLSPSGRCREVYLATPLGREDAWVTELQQPVA